MAGSTVSRRAFGNFLRDMRTRANKTALAAGLHAETSRMTIVRLEDGLLTKITTMQLKSLLDFYEADESSRSTALDLWQEVREQAKADKLQGNSKGFWQPYADQLPSHFPHYLRLEAAAARMTTHQLVLVHGLLQTSDYRRAIAKLDTPSISRVDIERRIELTERRQARLDEPDFRLEVLLSEAVLRNQPADPDVMAGQLHWLAEVSERDNISIRIVPFDVGPHRGLVIQSFTLLEFTNPESRPAEPPVVYLEGAVGALYHERADVIERYREAINALQAVALSEADTRTMVLRVAKEYAA
ncbi:helix-turn-helix transcriptional regulator [Nocardia sp. CDC153]|uniref:helix-turn-helix domain-containing protein n=1 Tax=Nocardia sp. CDC153 TaxID=3112167 RepID=UPI002DBB6D45|nr:helix-turn-helix transcriptional regulator [Nocardia sp. CDC153]MEC3955001.1 helix-turn-helix transcriptional regulator [Nocardia sp. CDC153]